MATEKVVWLLGSGFSKPLGGPLLKDLFVQEEEDDIAYVYPDGDYPDLARALPWVQKCFHLGRSRYWADAEEFLAYVDDAYSNPRKHPPRWHILQKLIKGSTSVLDANRWRQSDPPRHAAQTKYIETMPAFFGREVKRALAAECHRFLLNKDPDKSETFSPYKKWVESLRPGSDTVITFNYDLAIEQAASAAPGLQDRIQIVDPGNQGPLPGNIVPVLKLHGSVGWKRSGGRIDPVPFADVLKHEEDDIAIAAPGTSKEALAGGALKNLWKHAEDALGVATRLVIVGYSFPPSDPAAQIRLLDWFGRDDRGQKEIHIVVGPEVTTTPPRMLSIVRSTGIANGDVCVATYKPVTAADLVIVQHPLGAQDFIGRHRKYTVARTETRP